MSMVVNINNRFGVSKRLTTGVSGGWFGCARADMAQRRFVNRVELKRQVGAQSRIDFKRRA
jgi:hypothetical protein